MDFIREYLTIAEAADRRQVSRQAIFDLIKRGRLIGVKRGRQWFVLDKEIQDFIPQPVGRPRKREEVRNLQVGSGEGTKTETP